MLDARRRLLGLLVAFAAASAALPAGAAPTTRASSVAGAEFRVSGSGATESDWSPAIAANEVDNEYLVVWSDQRGATGAIYARRLATDGSRIGPDRRVSGSGAKGANQPAVVWNADAEEYLVVWEDSRNPSRGTDIYAARLSRNGTRITPDRRISSSQATGSEVSPALAYNSATNRYVVVWSDDRSQTSRGADIYGRRIGPDGRAWGAEFRVSGNGAKGQDVTPDISWAWSGTSEFIVVWSDYRKPGRGFDVFGRRLSALGAPIGADFRISSAGAGRSEYGAAVAWATATDEYLVVWEDERRSATRGSEIYGRRVLDGGTPTDGDFRISGKKATADDSDPGVAFSRTASEFLVVWSDARSYPNRAEDVYGRRVSASGVPAGNDFRISGFGATGAEADPRAAFLYDAAGLIVVWSDDRGGDSRSWDVFGRRVAG